MSGSSLGYVVETLVAILLLVTIGYCYIVNRKLERLRSDKSDLRAVIRDLYSATGHAEQALSNLRQTAGSIEETLGQQISSAQKTQSRLAENVERGEGLLSKLELVTRGGGAGPSQHPVQRVSQDQSHRAAAGGRDPVKLRHSDVGLGLLNAQRGKSYSRADDGAKEVA